jgi:hypothetical protein
MPLETSRFVVEMDLPSGRKVDLFVDLLWCRDFGNGWYASGGRFLGVP